jgi:hypothetical protein
MFLLVSVAFTLGFVVMGPVVGVIGVLIGGKVKKG